MFGPQDSKDWTSADLWKCWEHMPIQVWTGFCIFIWISFTWYVNRRLNQLKEAGAFNPDQGEMLDLTKPGMPYLACMRCVTSALIGTYTGVFSAATFLALGNTLSGENEFQITASTISTSYVLVIFFIGSNAWMELSKQEAMGLFGNMFVVPVYQVIIIVGLVITCGIYYGDFQEMKSGPIVVFSIGVITCAAGITYLAQYSAEPEDVKSEADNSIRADSIYADSVQLIGESPLMAPMSPAATLPPPWLGGRTSLQEQHMILEEVHPDYEMHQLMDGMEPFQLLKTAKALLAQRNLALTELHFQAHKPVTGDHSGSLSQKSAHLHTSLAQATLEKWARSAELQQRENKIARYLEVNNALTDHQKAVALTPTLSGQNVVADEQISAVTAPPTRWDIMRTSVFADHARRRRESDGGSIGAGDRNRTDSYNSSMMTPNSIGATPSSTTQRRTTNY